MFFVQVTGYPTLKLVTRGANEIVDYSGGRTLEDFKDFLDMNAVHEEDQKHEEL